MSDIYASYTPQRIKIAGARPHPTPLVESVAMAAVLPPMPTARPTLPTQLVTDGELSEAQLEAIIMANEAHERGSQRGDVADRAAGRGAVRN